MNLPFFRTLLLTPAAPLLAALGLGLVAGCGGDGHGDDTDYSGPGGFYRGYVELDNDAEMAAVDIAIDEEGNSTIVAFADNTDAASGIVIATADGSAPLTLRGSLHSAATSSDFAVEDGSVNANAMTASIDNVTLGGALTASQQTLTIDASIDGDYRFVDGSDRQWQATVSGTSVTLSSATCNVSGSIDDGGNGLYRVTLNNGSGSDCAGFGGAMKGTAYVDSLEAENDVLHVSIATAGSMLDTDWFR
jgi:hypothetical protein